MRQRKNAKCVLNILILALFLPLNANAQVLAGDSAAVIHLSLDSCIAKSLRNNVTSKNAELDLLIAQQTKKEAFTRYFPQIQGVAGAFHSDRPFIEYGISDLSNAGIRNTLQALYFEYGQALGLPNSVSFLEKGVVAGVSGVQPVYAGGRIVAGNRLANVGVQAAEYQLEIAKRDVMLQCEELYWQIVALEQKQATVAAATEMLENLERDVENAVEAGLTLQNDLLRVRLELNKIRSSKLQLDNGLVLSKSALCQYIGITPEDSVIVLTDTLTAVEDPALYRLDAEAAAASSYEAELLNLSVEAEKLKRRMTLGEALPQVGIGGAYAYNNLMEKDYTNLVGFATVQLPISEWWATGHKLKKHRYQIEKAQNTQSDLMQKLALQNSKLYDELQLAYRQVLIAEDAVKSAEENLRQCRDNYDAGLISLSELLEAQTLHTQAVDQLNEAKVQYRIKLRYYKQKIS